MVVKKRNFHGNKSRLILDIRQTSQSITNNTSTVVADLYVEVDRYYNISGSFGTSNANIKVNGTSKNKSISASSRNMNGYIKKKMHSSTFTVKHNNDGTKSISYSAYIEMAAGNGYFSPPGYSGNLKGSAAKYSVSGTLSLKTIPRQSTISSGWSRNIMNSNISIPINRKASSMTHYVDLYVGGTKISDTANPSEHTTSTNIKLSTAQRANALSKFGSTATSASAEIRYTTVNGSTRIGTSSSKGTVTRPATGSLSGSKTVSTSGSNSINISDYTSSYNYTFELLIGSTLIKRINPSSASSTYSFNSTETSKILELMGTNSSISGTMRLITKYSTTTLRTYSVTCTFSKSSADNMGNFGSTSLISYKSDRAIFNSTDNIIQSVTGAVITLSPNFLPEPSSGASIDRLRVTLGNYTQTFTGSSIPSRSSSMSISFTDKQTTLSGAVSLRFEAFDSYGNKRTTSTTVRILEYFKPRVELTAERFNGYEDDTSIDLNVAYSPVNGINGLSRNPVISIKSLLNNSVINVPPSSILKLNESNGKVNFSPVIQKLSNNQEWLIEVMVSDKLGNSTIDSVKVGRGKPTLTIDTERNNVSINSTGLPSNSGFYTDLKIGDEDGSLQVSKIFLNNVSPFIEDQGDGTVEINWNHVMSVSNDRKLGLKNIFRKDGIDLVPVSVDFDRNNSFHFNETIKNPNFLNRFSGYGGIFDSLRFYKNADGMVHFEGKLSRVDTSGKRTDMYHDVDKWTNVGPSIPNFSNESSESWIGKIAFVLPSGYRPRKRQVFILQSKRIDIFSSGHVVLSRLRYGQHLTNDWMFMNAIQFRGYN